MCATPEDQAAAFLHQIACHQDKLLAYAVSLARCPDAGHDLYADTLLKCRERIATAGFYGESYIPYMVTALRLNFYAGKRSEKQMESLQGVSLVEEGEDTTRSELATAISTFMAAHYPPDQVAMFELHVAGVTYNEIVFLTDFTYWQIQYLVNKMKKEMREMFKVK